MNEEIKSIINREAAQMNKFVHTRTLSFSDLKHHIKHAFFAECEIQLEVYDFDPNSAEVRAYLEKWEKFFIKEWQYIEAEFE